MDGVVLLLVADGGAVLEPADAAPGMTLNLGVNKQNLKCPGILKLY